MAATIGAAAIRPAAMEPASTKAGRASSGQTNATWVVQSPAVEWIDDGLLGSEFEQAVRVFTTSGGRIGVTIRDLSDEDLKTGKASAGVKIEEVETDSPASKAGFKAGDVIVEFDGERVRSSRQFARLVQETVPGRSVQAAVQREGQRLTMSVQPRESGYFRGSDRFDEFVFAAPKLAPKAVDVFPKVAALMGAGRLGITVDELSSQLADYFGTKEGVLVTSVTESSVANKAGLKAGDVITSLNGGAVASAADLRRRAQNLENGDEFTLNVMRDKKPLTLKGKIELQPRRATGRVVL
jgi:serine protease Do